MRFKFIPVWCSNTPFSGCLTHERFRGLASEWGLGTHSVQIMLLRNLLGEAGLRTGIPKEQWSFEVLSSWCSLLVQAHHLFNDLLRLDNDAWIGQDCAPFLVLLIRVGVQCPMVTWGLLQRILHLSITVRLFKTWHGCGTDIDLWSFLFLLNFNWLALLLQRQSFHLERVEILALVLPEDMVWSTTAEQRSFLLICFKRRFSVVEILWRPFTCDWQVT